MSDLPRKFTKRTPINLVATDLPFLIEIYYFIKNELVQADYNLSANELAICNQKLAEVKRIIENNIFGEALRVKTATIDGDKPEDINLSKFEEKEKE